MRISPPAILISLLLLWVSSFGRAQSITDLIRQGDQFEKEMKEPAAYQLFREVLKQQPNHLHALIRCSELASRLGKLQTQKTKQMEYYQAALDYATRALKVNASSSDANMVMAIAFGRMVLMRSGGEKISHVRSIKAYAEKSLQFNANNFKALHVLGRWHYEVSNLNMMERAGAKIFFGGIPAATIDSSIYYYEKARALSPGFLLNYLELSKAYYRKGQKGKSIQLLHHLLKLPDAASEDKLVRREANHLLKEWR